MNTYAYSLDDGQTWTGKFLSEMDAADEAAVGQPEGRLCLIGQVVPPTAPERYLTWDMIKDFILQQEDYDCSPAEGWPPKVDSDMEAELEHDLQRVFAAWLDSYEVRPNFWLVEDAQVWKLQTNGHQRWP